MGCVPSKEVQFPVMEKKVLPEVFVEPQPKTMREPSLSSSDDLGKTSDFDEFFQIPFENDADEIIISPREADYPSPTHVEQDKKQKSPDKIKWFKDWDPCKGSDDDSNCVQDVIMDQRELDNHAKMAPKSSSNSFKQLIAYLEKPTKGKESRDEILVRLILVWLSNQEVEKFVSEEATKDTPLGFLSLLGQKRSTYSTFFTILCRKAGVKCTQIHGVCKAGGYEPGDKDPDNLTCRWNAIYSKDTWHIIHPYWVCRSVFGKRTGGWIKLEASGKQIGKRQHEAVGVLQNAFKEYYIMPDPAEFIYRCHPDDAEWQLLPTQISRERFLDQAYILPPFWGLGMKLKSENRCLLEATNGTATLTFQAPKETANILNLDYKFLFKEGSGTKEAENKMLQHENLPRLVAKIRNATEWNFDIQLPVEGTYKIVIYGAPDLQPFLRLCEFKINCTQRKQDCRLTPINPGILGFGPGPCAEKAGLHLPSHSNGLITAEKGQKTTLGFQLDSDKAKSMKVKTKLFDSNSVECSDLVDCNITSSNIKVFELKITTTIDKEGDYGLQILTATYSNRSGPDEDNLKMTVVCNYMITTKSKLVKEKANQRLARRNLLSLIENEDLNYNEKIENIERSMEKCRKEKIPENDLDIANAQKILDLLKLRKEIHNAYLERRLENTEKAILNIKRSNYEPIFRESIRHLESVKSELRSFNGLTQDVLKIDKALTELSQIHVNNEIVTNALLALLVLFGEVSETTEIVDDVHGLAIEMAHKVRNQEIAKLKQINAKKAQVVIDKYTFEQTRNVNVAAAAVHKWVKDITSAMV